MAEYKSAGIAFSDHLPVVFIGKIGVRPFPKKYDFKSMQAKFAEIYSALEPTITLGTQHIVLENIQYGFRYPQHITLTNSHKFSTAHLQVHTSCPYIVVR